MNKVYYSSLTGSSNLSHQARLISISGLFSTPLNELCRILSDEFQRFFHLANVHTVLLHSVLVISHDRLTGAGVNVISLMSSFYITVAEISIWPDCRDFAKHSIDLQPQKIVVDPTSAKCKLWCKVHNDRNSILAVTVNDTRYLRESYTLAAKQFSFCGFGPEHELGCHIQFVAPAVLCFQHGRTAEQVPIWWSHGTRHDGGIVEVAFLSTLTNGCWWSFPCPQSDQCSRRASLGRLGKSRGQLFFW
ncbi:hypothetical protein T01_14057 [Trichinella spiralis]|uniref:Uncharacterized protein n=1 Tax=Trichinella spiralis TaxID=6334 RepID=A0A0V1BLC1_TRISP|nr:hypothetical protein T01_14057 [Trichinella spiralis]